MDDKFYMYYSPRLDAWLQVCGAVNPTRTMRCMRPYGHADEHEHARGETWTTDTPETTDRGTHTE